MLPDKAKELNLGTKRALFLAFDLAGAHLHQLVCPSQGVIGEKKLATEVLATAGG